MKDFEYYKDKPATWVKHQILSLYLQKLAYKVGWWCGTINYIDCFAGPWKSKAEDLSDTSPHIAIEELQKVRVGLANAKMNAPNIRCLFIEKDTDAANQLRKSVEGITNMEVQVINGEFEARIREVLEFASKPYKRFSLFFIDPTGWSGFGMNTIAPVLKSGNSEVLINFMTKDIIRFIDEPTTEVLPSFRSLFGPCDYSQRWNGLTRLDREDEIVRSYCECLKQVGGFKYVVSSVVLHPTNRRTHFHFIYGTRKLEGLRAFRDIEPQVMREQRLARAAAQQRSRITKSRQMEVLSSAEAGDGPYFDQLRDRYLKASKQEALKALELHGTMTFDELEALALQRPLTWSADLKEWLTEWKNTGMIRFEGLAPRGRVPLRDKNHKIVWVPTVANGLTTKLPAHQLPHHWVECVASAGHRL